MRAAALLALALCAWPSLANAQDARAQARTRFDHGLALYEEGRDEAALAELEEAYRLFPAWQVLFNIGRVHARLGRAVEAADAFERYLVDGGEEVPADRREEVTSLLREQRSRIARLTVTTNAERAIVVVDGIDVGEAPMSTPVHLAGGLHTVGVRADGYDPSQREVRLAGGTERALTFELTRVGEALASVRVVSAVPDVVIVVDGREVGRTPLSENIPLAPGQHVLEGRREGYVTARQLLDAAPGQQLDAALTPMEDPDGPSAELRLRLPEATGQVTVDGETVASPSSPVSVVPGQHHVRIELAGRAPLEETVRVANDGLDYAPSLRWRPDARQSRLDGAESQRVAGWLIAGTGLAAAAAGGVLIGVGSQHLGELEQAEWDLYQRCNGVTAPPRECTPVGGYTSQLELDGNDVSLTRAVFLGVGVGLAAAGALAMGVGLALALSAPSESDIDAEASVSARLAPGYVGLEGRF